MLNILIIVSSLAQVLGTLLKIDLLILIKPIPMMLMITYMSGFHIHKDKTVFELVRVALIMSLLGDIFLMVSGNLYFMIGTGCFFLAHVLYNVGFAMGKKQRSASFNNKIARACVTLCLLTVCSVNVLTLWNLIPNKILFPLYAFVLCFMIIMVVQRYEKTTNSSYIALVIGAFLFGISDNLLGFLKFHNIHSHQGSAAIMLTYYGGQYFLMQGTLLHCNSQHSIFGLLK